jgi:hypothetical protein
MNNHIKLLLPRGEFTPGKSRKTGNNRRAGQRITPDGNRQWYYTLHGHEVYVLTHYTNDTFTLRLDLCGYPTKTTAAAINEALDGSVLGGSVFSEKGQYFYNVMGWRLPFAPYGGVIILELDKRGMVIGNPVNAQVNAKCEVEAEWQGYAVTVKAGWDEVYTSQWVVTQSSFPTLRLSLGGVARSVFRGVAATNPDVVMMLRRLRSPERRNIALMAQVLAGKVQLIDYKEPV